MSVDDLVTSMARRFQRGQGTYFVGSGISAGSKLPTWLGLLQELAAERLGLTLSEDDDLVAIAQYLVNSNNGNRRAVVEPIYDLSTKSVNLNAYHHWIALTSGLKAIWTTNYDSLLEQAFTGRSLIVRHDDSSLQRPLSQGAVEIIKLHGCSERSRVEDLVITTQDYEDYEIRRPALAVRLSHELMTTSVLFIGYSYRDPNIRTALVQARRLMGETPPQHYLLLPDPRTDDRRFVYWCDDLRRVGLEVVLADNYGVVEDAIRRIALQSRGPTVYITGSHVMQGPDLDLPREIGILLADKTNTVLLDGQSEGAGQAAVEAFSRRCVARRQELTHRLRIYPNPYAVNPDFSNRSELVPELKRLRSALLSEARVVVALPGRMGTQAEVEEARRLGCHILPIPVGGDNYCMETLEREETHLPTAYVEAAKLGAPSADAVVAAVSELLR